MGITNYADTVVFDGNKRLVAIRFGGYPETVLAMSDALFSGSKIALRLPKEKSESEEPSVPLVILEEGKYNKTNLEKIHLNEEFFDDILRKQKVKKRRNVFIMTIDGNGKIYMQCYGENYRAFRAPLPEGISW